jgi:hypothetical protein
MASTPSPSKRLRQVFDAVIGDDGPAVDGDLAILGIETDDDIAGEGMAGAGDEFRLLDRLGADDAPGDAGVEVGGDGALVANAPADLDRQVRKRGGDGADGIAIDRLTGKGAIQVNQMQPAGAGIDPAPGHFNRVVREHGLVVHAALSQTHALAARSPAKRSPARR